MNNSDKFIILTNELINFYNLIKRIDTLTDNEYNVIERSLKFIKKYSNENEHHFDTILWLLENKKPLNKMLIQRGYNPCDIHWYVMNMKLFIEACDSLQ